MTLFTYVLVIIAASFAEAYEIDAVALLQAQVQGKIETCQACGRKSPVIDVEIEHVDDYKLAEDWKCSNKEFAISKSTATLYEPVFEPTMVVDVSASDELPDSNALKALVQLALVLLIADGMRRHHAQSRSADERVNGNTVSPKDAWVDMIKAAQSGEVNIFETALHSGACVSRTDAWGCTPLHFAAVGGSVHIATTLVDKGAEVDALDACDETPLHFAARADHASICEALLDARAAIDAVNMEGMTPLIVAGHANSKQACRILTDRGAGVAGLTDDQLPPLVVTEVLRKMLEGGDQ